jgi:hypothetical protein
MILGQASGVAAALAVDGKTTVQVVPVPHLQEKLRAQMTVLLPAGLERKTGALDRTHEPFCKNEEWFPNIPYRGRAIAHLSLLRIIPGENHALRQVWQ